ncbi:unnamed protein product [Leptidea sinapis]|uniref:Uncharacterized protein n=1 Tax=Leptidea sinapis TaxID=189913 RepID=A0A5E4QDL0_9NEOP|nr:unnamed protein product [Leptidea sinapis]
MYLKKQNFPMKQEFEEFNDEKDSAECSDGISESSDLENTLNEEPNSTPLDYTENALASNPVADFIKKEFIPDFTFNPFNNQSLGFKDGFPNPRSPFLLPTQLYKSFLATLGKRRRDVADYCSLYSRNMLFSNGLYEVSDDESAERSSDSPDEKAGASSAFVWTGGGVSGGGQEQATAQQNTVTSGASGGGAQGLVHWMSVMAEHMGGGHDPSHYPLPPWNNSGVENKPRRCVPEN